MANMIAEAIPPHYDIATTSRASRAILRHAGQRKDMGTGLVAHGTHVLPYVDSADIRGGIMLGKRQRSVDSASGRRLRRRLSSA